MALNRYVSDLEVGDVFEPIVYSLTPFMVREYCHGTGIHAEEFHSDHATGRQYVPPTMIHVDKMRLYAKNCPGDSGPSARIHYEFRSKQHQLIPTDVSLTASGKVTKRYIKRDRVYLELEIDLRETASGALLVEYWDTAVLSYAPGFRSGPTST